MILPQNEVNFSKMGHRKKKSYLNQLFTSVWLHLHANFHPRCSEIHVWVLSTGSPPILWLLLRFQNAKRDQNKINLVLPSTLDLARKLLLTGLSLALRAVTAPSAGLKKAKLCTALPHLLRTKHPSSPPLCSPGQRVLL